MNFAVALSLQFFFKHNLRILLISFSFLHYIFSSNLDFNHSFVHIEIRSKFLLLHGKTGIYFNQILYRTMPIAHISILSSIEVGSFKK